MDNQSIQHTRWNCTYHIVFIPKSALMFYDRHPEMRTKWGDRHLWARGYYVATVGNVNEETIRNYIREQEENDKLGEATK